MPVTRRLTAALAAAALGWSALTLGFASPAAAAHGQTVGEQATTHSPARQAPHDPATYYTGTAGLSGADLASVLNDIIDGHTTVSYATVFTAMEATDRDPNSSAAIIDFYAGTSNLASNKCGSSCGVDGWNREHTWPQSHGNFGTSNGPGTDLHHMRPEFGSTNSSRGNLDFDETVNSGGAVPLCAVCQRDSDSFEPRDAIKGDLARGLFYMAIRYDGESDDGSSLNFKMNDRTCNGSGPANLGKLSTLVAWSLADPPDAGERARNDLVDGTYQGNRNPFIDHPEWVTAIYGDGVGLGPACGSTTGSDTLPGGGTPPTNNPPTTSSKTATTAEDTATTVALTATDVDGDPLTWAVTTAASHGTAGVSGSTLTYTPALNYSGQDTVGVTVSDGRGGTASTTVTITVTPVNDPPLAGPATTSTPEDTAKSVALDATDPDGDPLTWSVTTTPSHGAAGISGRTLTYTPAADFNGTDSVGVTVSDGRGGSSSSTVTVTVTPVNDPPVASDVTDATERNTSRQVTLSGSDVDGNAVSFEAVTQPGHGAVTISGATATYTPTTGYTGPDSFTYRSKDPSGATSAPATVAITVTLTPQAPVATPVAASTDEDDAVTFTLTASDPNGDQLTYSIATQPAHGSVTRTGDQATYTPEPDFNGTDSFTWSVTDGSTSVTTTATITVNPVNDPPVASSRTLTTAEDTPFSVGLSASDADGDELTYAVDTGPAHGTVSLTGSTVTYTPVADYHGPDSFTFTAGDAVSTSAPATVSITVTPVNDAPVAAPRSATTPEDTATTVTLSGSDVDGDILVFALAALPTHGSVTLGGVEATYTPDDDYHGTDAFTWTVSDGTATTTTTATVVVTPVNDPPTVEPLAAMTDEDGGVTIPLSGEDVDGDTLTFARAAGAAHGTVVVAGATATYTPTRGYSGPDSFTYTASDGALTSAPATVAITVNAINHPPTVSAKLLHTAAGSPVSGTLVATDPDGDAVTIIGVSAPEHGSVTSSGLMLTYTPATRSGTVTFVVTVSDGHGGTATAQVGVEISPRTTQLLLATPPTTRGTPVTTTVTAFAPTGMRPTGSVTLTAGGTAVGTADLGSEGTATVTWTPRAAGSTALVATYPGDSLFDAATSDPSSLAVARSAARLTLSAGTLKRGRAGTIKATVRTVAGVAATGKVTLSVAGRKLTATLSRGVATFRIARLPTTPKLRTSARFAGDTQYEAGAGARTFTLRKP